MKNLIKDLFNIDEGQIEKFNSHNQEQDIIIHVKLKKRSEPVFCPVCGNKLSGNSTKADQPQDINRP